uniref:Uncharacterized protein n=1 Tax=Brassica oleracea TaxID=3712 RepID=A0A3P6F8B5_BRAOL|nr:unnamed protein product [Brassica oleracea]
MTAGSRVFLKLQWNTWSCGHLIIEPLSLASQLRMRLLTNGASFLTKE